MEEIEITRPTILEVNVSNFKYNMDQIKRRLNTKTTIMPIMKANAYGTYLNTKLEILNKYEIIGVAIVDEGIALRKIGYKKDIFILNQPYISEIGKIVENNLVIGLSSLKFLKELQKQNKIIKVHIEIETGMGRTGIAFEDIEKFIKELKETKNIEIQGIYTHLSSADNDDEYTKKQLKNFQKAVKKITAIIGKVKYIHVVASNGIINYPESQYNLVRAGMIMYGYESGENIKEKISLKPVCKLKSKITFLKTVKKDSSISYSRKFITKKESKIATIPIGYADGLPRNLSNKGQVIIKGQKVPIIGNICMDSFMVDVTDIENVSEGDEVLIWDNEQITIEEIARKCGTINYEILSRISERVPRKFIENMNNKIK